MDEKLIQKFMDKYGSYDTDVLNATKKRYVGEEFEAISRILAKRNGEVKDGATLNNETRPSESAANHTEKRIAAEEPPHSRNGSAIPGTTAVTRHYKDAYRTATAIVSFGSLIKVIGIILAVIILIACFVLGRELGSLVLGGIIMAVLVGGIFYVCGILASAAGQILYANLDTAVNTSQSLSLKDKADIISLSK